MNDMHMISALQEMLFYTVVAVCIITIPTLLVGLVMSILQAATQVNEMTLTFIPKLIVMFGLLLVLSPWLMTKLIHIMRNFMMNLPNYIY